MNFAGNRQTQQQTPSSIINDMTPSHHSHHPTPHKRRHIDWAARTVRIELFIILLGCALILIAVSIYLGLNNNTTNSELNRVAGDKYQAVFLTGGASTNSDYSTYFGHITSINDRYLVLQNVFYLTAGESAKTGSTSQLTKLGCDQAHAPYDQMVINRSQVAFWENIRDDGQVVKAIGEYNKKFPNGPQCTTTTNSSSTAPTASPSTTPTTTP